MNTKRCRKSASSRSNWPVARKKSKNSKARGEESTLCREFTMLANQEKDSAASVEEAAEDLEEDLAPEEGEEDLALAAEEDLVVPEEVWLLNCVAKYSRELTRL